MTEQSGTWNGRTAGGFLPGLLFGGLVGAVVGLLLAPQSGVKTRGMLREGVEDVRSQVDAKARDTRQKAERLMDDTKARAVELRERGSQAIRGRVDRVERMAKSGVDAAREAWQADES